MEDDRIPDFPKDKDSINDTREPKIFNVSEERLDRRECWPDCSPCSPGGDCSPDVLCSPDMRDDWGSCRPCSPNGVSRSDYDDFNREYSRGWSSCSPCSPDGDCRPDFSDDDK